MKKLLITGLSIIWLIAGIIIGVVWKDATFEINCFIYSMALIPFLVVFFFYIRPFIAKVILYRDSKSSESNKKINRIGYVFNQYVFNPLVVSIWLLSTIFLFLKIFDLYLVTYCTLYFIFTFYVIFVLYYEYIQTHSYVGFSALGKVVFIGNRKIEIAKQGNNYIVSSGNNAAGILIFFIIIKDTLLSVIRLILGLVVLIRAIFSNNYLELLCLNRDFLSEREARAKASGYFALFGNLSLMGCFLISFLGLYNIKSSDTISFSVSPLTLSQVGDADSPDRYWTTISVDSKKDNYKDVRFSIVFYFESPTKEMVPACYSSGLWFKGKETRTIEVLTGNNKDFVMNEKGYAVVTIGTLDFSNLRYFYYLGNGFSKSVKITY